MPLTRGTIVGYDSVRMMFRFTMIAPNNTSIECEISSAAMDLLAATKGTGPTRREALFLRLRDQIERAGSELFDQDSRAPIRIFAKHFGLSKKPHPPLL